MEDINNKQNGYIIRNQKQQKITQAEKIINRINFNN